MLSFLVCFVGLVAVSSAQFLTLPWETGVPQMVLSRSGSNYVVVPLIEPTTKYHMQDNLGQFAFGHIGDNQAREEVKSVDGTVRGAYSYIDPMGKLIKVQYHADHNGFRVLGANNLPIAPQMTLKDTPEVAEAKEKFAKEFEKVKEERSMRKRRDILLTDHLHTPFYYNPWIQPITIKTSEFKPVDAKTPAATRMAEFHETEKQFLSPMLIGKW